ncbi:hypothetical protein M153_8013000139, partial [Pseudoloma neurophilia]
MFFCQTCKSTKHKYGQVSGSIVTCWPLEDLSADVFGPFNATDFEHD